MVRRISFFGSPSAGKSTTAAFIFSSLKERGYHAEQVQEWVKKLAHQKIELNYWHQVLIFGEQLMSEYTLQEKDKELITVSDSPTFLPWMYSYHFKRPYANALKEIWREYNAQAPAELVIRLNPKGRFYNPRGRYQTKEEAAKLDDELMEMINAERIPYIEFDTSQKDLILECVLSHLGNPADFLEKR